MSSAVAKLGRISFIRIFAAHPRLGVGDEYHETLDPGDPVAAPTEFGDGDLYLFAHLDGLFLGKRALRPLLRLGIALATPPPSRDLLQYRRSCR